MKKFEKVLKDCVHAVEENTMLMWGFTYKK